MANPLLRNRQLASDTARLNLLTNGGFEIWQRGNGPFTAGGTFFADRWSIYLAGTDALSVSRVAAAAGLPSQYAAGVTFTLGTGGGNSSVNQMLKVADENVFNGKTLSLSVWINSSTNGAARLYLQTDGAGGVVTNSASSVAGTQVLTVSATVPNNATFVSVGIQFLATATVYIDNAMLVVGSQAADYAPLHPAEDLARCLRYYETISAAAGSAVAAGGQVLSTTLWWGNVPLLAYKAVGTPTVTFSPPATFACVHGAGTQTSLTAIGIMTAADPKRTIAIQGTSAGLTQGGGSLTAAAGQTATISVESNP
jgi:hypothetical protein